MNNTNNNQLPLVEEIKELKNEIPSFEEFLQTHQNDERISASYQNESNAEWEKGYGPCSYNPHEVNLLGKHIKECGSLNCSYYRRITYSTAGGSFGVGFSTSTGVGFITALCATPFTGGASLLLATGLSAGASASLVGGNVLSLHAANEHLNSVERELRLEWEEDERIREKNRRISNLQGQLAEAKRDLESAIEGMDMCKSDSDYAREKSKKESSENKVKNLKRDLCREKNCGCGGYCL